MDNLGRVLETWVKHLHLCIHWPMFKIHISGNLASGNRVMRGLGVRVREHKCLWYLGYLIFARAWVESWFCVVGELSSAVTTN